jgi:ABC-2 type transport system ATP-binding protein
VAATAAVVLDRVTKRYGKVVALDDLSLTVAQGVFGFLGPNGAGKTTAVKILLGLTRPTEGSGSLAGAHFGSKGSLRRIGYLPELFRYQSWLTAREVLALHCELAGLARSTWAAEIARVLETVGLSGRADDRVGGFSKGMQQRLGLAVALLGAPELVVLDEPTSALDPVGRYDVRRIIGGLRERGTTVFLNSHLLTEVERVCDRVAIVDRGEVIASGGVGDLAGEPSVRVRVTGLDAAARAALAAYGAVSDEGEWLRVRGLRDGAVPDLVAELVRRGGRVYAVEPQHRTLEERFIELVGERERA